MENTMEPQPKLRQAFSKGNVYIHPSKDESIVGTLYVLCEEGTNTTYLAWSPKQNDSEEDTNNNGKTHGLSNELYSVKVPLKDIRSIKRYIPAAIGIPHIIVITHSGVAFPPFHFHDGGVRELFYGLQEFVSLTRSDEDSNLFYIHGLLSPVLSHHRGHDKPKEIKAIENGAWTILEGFSLVARFARQATTGKLLKEMHSPPNRRHSDRCQQAQSDVGVFEVLLSKEESASKVERLPELSDIEWKAWFDEQGKIKDVDSLKRRIFYGGVSPALRPEVWKFLLNYYPWKSTTEERAQIDKEKSNTYARWKKLYLDVDSEQFKMAKFHLRQRNVEKDVVRTDRSIDFYKGENNPNLKMLDDLLNVYCFYNTDLGYVQGMNELASPILFVMKNESEAFWCFKGLMDVMESNFHKDQNGMHRLITQLRGLVKTLDPNLFSYLEQHDCLNFFYCFRWLLIDFKREFSFDDIQRFWEILWTNYHTTSFQLFVAAAILMKHRKAILSEQMEFDDLLKYMNELSGKLSVEESIEDAEYLYNLYSKPQVKA